MSRLDELRANLATVHGRIRAAEAAAGRAEGEVGLVVVTKFFPASDVRLLADLGVTDVGENRHQEAEQKRADCADLDVSWHFIGGLQTNKAAAVARYADIVESVDRVELVTRLARGAAERDRPVGVLLQVSLDAATATHRSGAAPEALTDLAAAVAQQPELRLLGLMAVAPLGEDPARAFARLATIREEFRADHPQATRLSAGMSGDLEQAIAAGATHVRVGSAVLGSRPSLQ